MFALPSRYLTSDKASPILSTYSYFECSLPTLLWSFPQLICGLALVPFPRGVAIVVGDASVFLISSSIFWRNYVVVRLVL